MKMWLKLNYTANQLKNMNADQINDLRHLSNVDILIENAITAVQEFAEKKIITLGANNRYKF